MLAFYSPLKRRRYLLGANGWPLTKRSVNSLNESRPHSFSPPMDACRRTDTCRLPPPPANRRMRPFIKRRAPSLLSNPNPNLELFYIFIILLKTKAYCVNRNDDPKIDNLLLLLPPPKSFAHEQYLTGLVCGVQSICVHACMQGCMNLHVKSSARASCSI